MSKKLSYYDYGPVLSRNAVINMVMGARGLGKTYGAKKIVIKDFISHGNQFIYLRRYKEEQRSKFTFFSDIAHEFPEWEFRVNGNEAQMKPVGGDRKEWGTCGYFNVLSTSQQNKSTAYPLVRTIIFDEFIIEKGSVRYLPNEVNYLLNFYSTVDRWKDKTRVLMLSNSISIMNPYFSEYKITPESEFVMRGKGFICAHFADSERFANEVSQTRFGRFIKEFQSEFADYAVGNVFHDNEDSFIEKKTGEARYMLTLKTRSGYFSIWSDMVNYYAQRKRPKGGERIYSLWTCKHAPGEVQLERNSKILQMLRRFYRNGKMYFDIQSTRNTFSEIFRG